MAESPGVLDFASPSIVVDESAGFALVTVVDRSGAGGTVTVHYQTAGGNATPGLDYMPTSGTLTFGPGVTTQSFRFPSSTILTTTTTSWWDSSSIRPPRARCWEARPPQPSGFETSIRM